MKVPPIRDDVTPDLPTQRLTIKVKLGIGRGKRELRCLEPVRQADRDNVKLSLLKKHPKNTDTNECQTITIRPAQNPSL